VKLLYPVNRCKPERRDARLGPQKRVFQKGGFKRRGGLLQKKRKRKKSNPKFKQKKWANPSKKKKK